VAVRPPGAPRPFAGAHAEAVAAAILDASEWQAEAFRSAVFPVPLRFWVIEREAIAAIWDGSPWRARTAEYADAQLDLADRLTGEGALPPGEGR
jgi:hypothetical protein